MIECSVESCESNFNSELRSSVIFFEFPQLKDGQRFHKWVEAAGKPSECFEKEGKFVCSRHFRLTDFQKNEDEDKKSRLSLMDDAVPSLYLCEDNKMLPKCNIYSESGNIDSFVVDVGCIKTERCSEGDLTERGEVNGICSNSIPVKNESIKDEPQENIFEDNTTNESQTVANQPSHITHNLESQNDYNLLKKKFKCKKCKLSFAFSTELKNHKRKIHGTYVCNICSKKVAQLSKLKIHRRRKHNISYVYNCEHCDNSFFRGDELLRHMKLTHEITKHISTKKCWKCKKQFESIAQFLTHECTVTEKQFQCELCNNRFAREAGLNMHKRKFHLKNKEPDNKHKCDDCGKVYNKKHSLRVHKTIHKRQFECETCKRAFVCRHQLKIHQLNHTAVECVHLGKMKY